MKKHASPGTPLGRIRYERKYWAPPAPTRARSALFFTAPARAAERQVDDFRQQDFGQHGVGVCDSGPCGRAFTAPVRVAEWRVDDFNQQECGQRSMSVCDSDLCGRAVVYSTNEEEASYISKT